MGTQGLRTHLLIHTWAVAKRRRLLSAAIMSSLALPALAGCSSFSSPFASSTAPPAPPSPYQTAGMPPPNASPQPTAQGAYVPPPAAASAAPSGYAPRGGIITPTPAITPDDPRNSVYPTVSLVDLFKSDFASASSANSSSTSAASGGPPANPLDNVYPSVSLVDLFKSDSPSAATSPNVPRPPSTYTPVGQPYSPPPGQPAASLPPQPPATNPAPPSAPAAAPAQSSEAEPTASVYPTQSLMDIFKRN